MSEMNLDKHNADLLNFMFAQKLKQFAKIKTTEQFTF